MAGTGSHHMNETKGYREITIAGCRYAEIEIIGSLMPHHLPPGTRIGNGNAVVEKTVSAADVLAAIDAAERDGIRVLLVVLGCPGGELGSGLRVFNRLRAFSDAGGKVVAFVQGPCASTAPIVAQAADFIIMRADGKFRLHSATGPGVDIEAANDAQARVLAARTGMAVEKLRAYLSDVEVMCEIHDLGALRLGWCDCTPETIEGARSWAGLFAQGAAIPETARSRRLARAAPVVAGTVPAGVCAAHQTQSSESTFDSVGAARWAQAQATLLATSRWTEVSLPVGGHYWDVKWTGRMWLAVGTGNIGVASADVHAASWASKTMGVAGATWTGIASDGAGRVLVVGATSKSSLSTDWGETFTAQTIPIDAKAVCWDEANSRFVAVGTGVCATSATGATGSWTTRSIPNLPAGYNTHYEAVTANGSVLCAVGWTDFYHGICSVSTDGGATWTAHDVYAGASQTLVSVVALRGGFVAVDVMSPGYILTSEDGGATWAAAAGPTPSSGRPIATDGTALVLMSNTEYQNVPPALQYPCAWVSGGGGGLWGPVYGPRQVSANRNYTAVAFNGTHWVAVAQSQDGGATAKATVSQ